MSDIFRFLMNVAHALNPRVSDTPEQIFAWRQTVAVTLVLLSILTTFTALQANGWLQFAGVRGFVTTTQIATSEQLLLETRIDQLVQRILEDTRRYCQSYEAGDTQGMSFAFKALQDTRAKYFALMQREYPQLMCSMSAQPSTPTQ